MPYRSRFVIQQNMREPNKQEDTMVVTRAQIFLRLLRNAFTENIQRIPVSGHFLPLQLAGVIQTDLCSLSELCSWTNNRFTCKPD